MYIDSGGYSIIKGDVKPGDTRKFIGCYNKYLEKEWETFDYIFSLDIPINLKYKYFNTKANITKFNKEALEMSKELLLDNPELKKKFIFIWQFKMQYDVWCSLYENLKLNKIIQNRAIGGLVSLQKIAGLDFSPFIALSCRCLLDYILAEKEIDFKLHYLGIKTKTDRFHMAFIEQLFRKYLDDNSQGAEIKITYDSINFARTAQMNFKNIDIFSFDKENWNEPWKIQEAPEEVLKKVYFDDVLYGGIISEFANLNNKRKLNNPDCFAPLNIYSNMSLDRFFCSLIEEHELANMMYDSKNIFELKANMQKVLKILTAEHPKIFTRYMVKSIKTNMEITFKLHIYMKRRDFRSVHQVIHGFIKMIDFPDKLA